jgi:hypothetical protein
MQYNEETLALLVIKCYHSLVTRFTLPVELLNVNCMELIDMCLQL